MDAYKWAAVVVVGWGFGSAVVAVFTGRFIDEWRDYCAEFAKRQQFQQFDVEPRYVDAEIARIEAELNQSDKHEAEGL